MSVESRLTTVPVPWNVSVVESVPARVSVLLAVSVLPSAIAKVEPVAGAVIASLLMLVAEATPKVGVTSVGLVARTTEPEPVVPSLKSETEGRAEIIRPVDKIDVTNWCAAPPKGCTGFESASGSVNVRAALAVPVTLMLFVAEPPIYRLANGFEAEPMSVPPAAFGVNAPVSPVMLVAVAAPIFGVVSVGDVARTTKPEPVVPSLRSAAAG